LARHVIFFVAGIGDDAKGWSQELRARFQQLFDSYPLPPGGLPFDELFQTEEILYNDLFDAWRKRVASEASNALRLLGDEGLPNDAVQRLLELGQAAGGGGFLRTHALDVLQYRFLRLISEAARDAVEARIMAALGETEFGTPLRWSIVAHSLGTAVTHDALHQMFRPGPGAEASELFQPYAMVMLANVSQLLHDPRVLGHGVDAYRSFVRPSRNPDEGACRYYVSATNRLDPVARAGNFSPPMDWLPPAAQAQRRYRPLEFTALPKTGNVHGYREYLEHPAVHVPLFRILAGDPDRITDAQENEAHEKYRAANALPAVGDLGRQALEELAQRATGAGWAELVSIWKEVLDHFTS
jgi:hypothetical protein